MHTPTHRRQRATTKAVYIPVVILAAVDVGAVTGALVQVEVRQDHLVHHLQTTHKRPHIGHAKYKGTHEQMQGRSPHCPQRNLDSQTCRKRRARNAVILCSLGKGTLATTDTVPELFCQCSKQIHLSNADYRLSVGHVRPVRQLSPRLVPKRYDETALLGRRGASILLPSG